MRSGDLELTPAPGGGVAVTYRGRPMVAELGLGIPIDQRWLWSFDGSLILASTSQEEGWDVLGEFDALVSVYADATGPLVQQRLKLYRAAPDLVVEVITLRDLAGTALEDSFYNTTFNAPVVRLAPGLAYLTYTWGLRGGEGSGIGGSFPDAAVAPDLASLPETLRRADFSPTADLHQTGEKPFGPLIAFDSEDNTLVMAPLDHFLISPLRLLDTPSGPAVARGIHGSVDFIPRDTTTRTILSFGTGLGDTVYRWGRLLRRNGGKQPDAGRESALVGKLGFWNCYGGYYADLFRPTNADTLGRLADYFREGGVPVRYFGLDLWYLFDRVGFAKGYRPHPEKFPQGLRAVSQETGLPLLLHMSAFDLDNEHRSSYQFVVDEGSAYPAGHDFYQDRAREFKEWGAMGIWPDFLRTQFQNSRSLRDRVGAADAWFGGLCRAMAEAGLEVMLCMPTVGHYLASTQHDNVIAVRTSTDYVNHQVGQLAHLGRYIAEYRSPNTPQRNLRQNLLLSLLAGALGLAPSYDVFITNKEHPEGFAEPDAEMQALARSLSGGVVGIGDKAGFVDGNIIDRLAFPDGTLSQPDHPPVPLASTLGSDVMAFYTTTTIDGFRWTYLALFNLADAESPYQVDLQPFLEDGGSPAYDYFAQRVVQEGRLAGSLGLRGFRFLVLPPVVNGLGLLGFVDKYVTVSARQVKAIGVAYGSVTLELELPEERDYVFALAGEVSLDVEGRGLTALSVERRRGMTYVGFRAEQRRSRLVLRRDERR